MDLVGIDLGPQRECLDARLCCRSRTAFHGVDREQPLIPRMIEQRANRPQRQGRILSPGALRRRPSQGGDRSENGRIPGGTDARYCPKSRQRAGSTCAAVRTRKGRLLTPFAFSRRPLLTLRRWSRRRPRQSPTSMRRCGSATTGSWGPFELADKLGSAWLVEHADRADLVRAEAAGGGRWQELLSFRRWQASVSRHRRRLP